MLFTIKNERKERPTQGATQACRRGFVFAVVNHKPAAAIEGCDPMGVPG